MAKKPVTTEETVRWLRQHARVLFEMPAGEQWIGARDTVLNSALYQIADWMEAHDARAQRITRQRSSRAT